MAILYWMYPLISLSSFWLDIVYCYTLDIVFIIYIIRNVWYDLSKQVDSIRVTRRVSGYEIDAKKDGENLISKINLSEQELTEHIGKDLAKKAIKDLQQGPAVTIATKTYSGLDLKVGGEGMAGFYDKILPTSVNKYVKKWGGKTESTYIVTNKDLAFLGIPPGFSWEAAKKEGTASEVHSLTITPSMKDSAMLGQPMFSRDVTKTPEFKRWFGDSKVVDENGEPFR